MCRYVLNGSTRSQRPSNFACHSLCCSHCIFCHCSNPAVLWHCWLGVRKSVRPVNIEWWGVGVVICLDRGADCLHMVQLMPLQPQTPSSLASFKSRLVLPFGYWLTQRLWSYDLMALYKSVYYYFFLTPVLNSRGMKKLRYAIQKSTKIKLEWTLLLLLLHKTVMQ